MSRTMAENPAFSLREEDGIATLRFRKAFLNVALDLHTRDEFLEQLDRLENDPNVLGMVQINDEQFSGEDEIRSLMEHLVEKDRGNLSVLHRFKRSFVQIMARNLEFPKPVVNGVIGHTTLDEFGVALMTDRVLLSESCHISNVSLGVGLPAGPIMTFFLPRIVGAKRAITLLTDESGIDASRAFDLGLADAVFPADKLEEECRAEVQRLSRLPSPVVSETRKLIISQYDEFEAHADRSLKLTVKVLQSRDW